MILSGDMAHFHENYDSDGVPGFNSDRSESIASIERVKQIAEEPQRDGHHPARPARRGQAAGVPGRGEVTSLVIPGRRASGAPGIQVFPRNAVFWISGSGLRPAPE